jgi:hypothetical protein
MSLFGALKQQKWGVFLHFLETVVVSSSSTACTALHYALNNCYHSAEVPQSQIITVYSYRHVTFWCFAYLNTERTRTAAVMQ